MAGVNDKYDIPLWLNGLNTETTESTEEKTQREHRETANSKLIALPPCTLRDGIPVTDMVKGCFNEN